VSWVNRFLPQLRFESGALFGELHAEVAADRTVTIAAARPFEVRGADVRWGDVELPRGARLRVSPTIRITRRSVETRLDAIEFADEAGNRLDGTIRLGARGGEQDPLTLAAQLRVRAPSLTDRIGKLGDFDLQTDGAFDPASGVLTVSKASFDCRDVQQRSYFSGSSIAPFAVVLDPFEVRAIGASDDLFRATFVPLHLPEIFPEPLGFAVDGPLPRGEAKITARDGGLWLHSERPLVFGPMTVSRAGVRLLEGVEFAFTPEVHYTRQGVRARAMRLEISARDRRLVTIASDADFDIVGQAPRRSAAAEVELDLPGLFEQPIGRGFPGFRSGTARLQARAGFRPQRSHELRLQLADTTLADGTALPGLEASALVRGEGDTVQIDVPVAIRAADRTSDLRARGTRARAATGEYRLDLAIDSQRLVLDDVMALVNGLLARQPAPATAAPAQAAVGAERSAIEELLAERDGRPFWSGYHGTVPVMLGAVELDRYTLHGAGATLAVEDAGIALTDIRAELFGSQLTGRLALGFDERLARPYTLDLALDVEQIDLGRIFTVVRPQEPPVLEGRFRIEATAGGAGTNPLESLVESQARVHLTGSDGVFRGLAELGKLSSLTKAAGILTFSKELRAAGRLFKELRAFPFESAEILLERDPARGLQLRTLDLRSPQMQVHGEGLVLRDRKAALVDRKIDLRAELAVADDVAILFDGMGLLEEGAAEPGGLREVSRPFAIGGTLAAPDASALYEMLDEAANNAKGSFGLVMRKARKALGPPSEP
jgi:hypothetical protein